MNECERKAAALGIMVYNHIAEAGKKPSVKDASMELSMEDINPECFSQAMALIERMRMDKLSMNIIDCH